ncbi:hypothetical protein OG194_14075 [Streptomyces sp. NBC_01288]|uniref:hypothetical protein n=1 Tax=Streptomyces sp. NBC_01288 TaxID=2903814 RepID=UPI002E0FCC8D|nr:hypothetical protein OG194_14075 [Streptomyces sp. NBC_01288]
MSEFTPEIGDLAFDEAVCQVGRAMGHEGPHWQLRPVGGGREWDAEGPIRPPTDAERLSADVAVANARSRSGL